MAAVAQVRAHPRAGVDRGSDLLGRGGRVADRNDNVAVGNTADELARPVVFGRHGEDSDHAGGSFLQPLELVPVGRADELELMGATRSVLRREKRALDMNAGELAGHNRRTPTGGRYGLQRVGHCPKRVGRHRGV